MRRDYRREFCKYVRVPDSRNSRRIYAVAIIRSRPNPQPKVTKEEALKCDKPEPAIPALEEAPKETLKHDRPEPAIPATEETPKETFVCPSCKRELNRITVAELSAFCHCSNSYLSRIFKRRIGVNINVYVNKVCMEFAKNPLCLSNESIAGIAASVGFDDPNYFSRVFTQIIGISPTEFRKRFHQDIS